MPYWLTMKIKPVLKITLSCICLSLYLAPFCKAQDIGEEKRIEEVRQYTIKQYTKEGLLQRDPPYVDYFDALNDDNPYVQALAAQNIADLAMASFQPASFAITPNVMQRLSRLMKTDIPILRFWSSIAYIRCSQDEDEWADNNALELAFTNLFSNFVDRFNPYKRPSSNFLDFIANHAGFSRTRIGKAFTKTIKVFIRDFRQNGRDTTELEQLLSDSKDSLAIIFWDAVESVRSFFTRKR